MKSETTVADASDQSIVTLRWYVTTGKNRLTIDAPTTNKAIEEAIERIVSDDNTSRSMGQLVMASLVGFDAESDDDVFSSTVSVMERIGFRRNDDDELVRCKTCKGVGRLDCCDKLSCLDCGGMSTRICRDC